MILLYPLFSHYLVSRFLFRPLPCALVLDAMVVFFLGPPDPHANISNLGVPSNSPKRFDAVNTLPFETTKGKEVLCTKL